MIGGKREHNIQFRVTTSEKNTLERAAKSAGSRTLSEFARAAALLRADTEYISRRINDSKDNPQGTGSRKRA